MEEEAGRVGGVLKEAIDSISLLSRLPHTSSQLSQLATIMEDAGFEAVASEIEALAQAEQLYRDSLRTNQARNNPVYGHPAPRRNGGIMEPPIPPSDANYKQQLVSLLAIFRVFPEAKNYLPDAPSLPKLDEFASGPLTAFQNLAMQRIVTTKSQAEETAVEVRNKQARINSAEQELLLLKDELKKARQKRSTAKAAIAEAMVKLRNDEEVIRRTAEEEMKGVRASTKEKLGEVAVNFEEEEEKLREELRARVKALQMLRANHLEQEENHCKRKDRLKMELETVVKECDSQLSTYYKEIDELNASIKELQLPLEQFEKYYKQVDEEMERQAMEAYKDHVARLRAKLKRAFRSVFLMVKVTRRWNLILEERNLRKAAEAASKKKGDKKKR